MTTAVWNSSGQGAARAYYNEIDPNAAQWLRNLIAAGHIAAGDVDERSIEDVRPSDLAGYTQCHFFAGIGIWSYALRLAGWPDDRSVWTGSCPCQPFSKAGQGTAFADERHLWPAWHHLIKERKPPAVFGEQVGAAVRHGWLDLVQDDLEGIGYAVGPVGFPAAGVGAPHIRERIYFVADTDRTGCSEGSERRSPMGHRTTVEPDRGSFRMADHRSQGLEKCQWVRRIPAGTAGSDAGQASQRGGVLATADNGTGPTNGHWRDADWLFCRDGKWRPVEPGTFPLAHGAPARVGRLRAYGNGIVAQAAQAFIEEYVMERGIQRSVALTAAQESS